MSLIRALERGEDFDQFLAGVGEAGVFRSTSNADLHVSEHRDRTLEIALKYFEQL